MSDRDSWPANPNETYQQAPSSSGGGCFKAFLIIGVLGIVCMLLCCGAGAWFFSTLAPKQTSNPAEVTEAAQQILKMDLPAEYVGANAISIDNFFVTLQVANFKRKTSDSYLLVGRVAVKIGSANNQQDQMKQQFQMMGIDDKSLDILKSETREFEIDGKKIPFKFCEAVSPATKKEFRVVEGKMGTAIDGKFVKFVIEAGDYDEDEVVKIIESIH